MSKISAEDIESLVREGVPRELIDGYPDDFERGHIHYATCSSTAAISTHTLRQSPCRKQ